MSLLGLFGSGGLLNQQNKPGGLLGSMLQPNEGLLMTGLGMLGGGWAGALPGLQAGLKAQRERTDRGQALQDLRTEIGYGSQTPGMQPSPGLAFGAPTQLPGFGTSPTPSPVNLPNFVSPAPASPAGGARAGAEKQGYGSQAAGTLDPRNRDMVIRTVLAESGGEGPVGMSATANVIRNRAVAGRYGGSSPDRVVMAKGQFEPWGTPQGRQKLMGFDPNSDAYRQAGAIVDEVWGGSAPDPTRGATHFYAPKLQASLGRNAPSWARNPLATIGGHQFFAPEGVVAGGSPQALTSTPQTVSLSNGGTQMPTPVSGGSTPGQATSGGGQGLLATLFAGFTPQQVDRYARMLLNPNTADLTAKLLLHRAKNLEGGGFEYQKQGEDIVILQNGREVNRVRAPQNQAGGPFEGKSVDAQALNMLVQQGVLTPQQAALLGAGKFATGPNGELNFIMPNAIFPQGQTPTQPIAPQQFGADPPPAAPPAAAPVEGMTPPAAPAVPGPGPQMDPTAPAAPSPAPRPGVQQITPGRPQGFNEVQGKAAGFADRMSASAPVIEKFALAGTDWRNRALEWANDYDPTGLTNWAKSAEFQQLEQAQRNFINAQLRRESGALINKDEFANARRQYLPMPGDSEEVLQQKRKNREDVINAMAREAGPAYRRAAEPPSDTVVIDGVTIRRKD